MIELLSRRAPARRHRDRRRQRGDARRAAAGLPARRQRQRVRRRIPAVGDGERTASPAQEASAAPRHATARGRGDDRGRRIASRAPRVAGARRALARIDRERTLRELFAADPARGERLTAEAAGLYLDYSKQRITDETLRLLVALADESGLAARIDAMFRGEQINVTENRAALHVALRAPQGRRSSSTARTSCRTCTGARPDGGLRRRVRSGAWKGHTGRRIRNVVNIGIGGSDLGPVMAYEALRHYSDRALTFRFVSNVDATDFVEAVRDLDPARRSSSSRRRRSRRWRR